MKILSRFYSKNETLAELNSLDEIKAFKRLVNPTFRRIKKSKYFWANCLSTSILIWFILKKQGLDTQLVIGTSKKEKKFKAHAWVEYKGFPLNDNKKVREEYHAFNHNFSNIIS